MIKVKTKYDREKHTAIITNPTEIPIKEKEYRTIQKLFNKEFGYLCIIGDIVLKNNSIVGLNISNLDIESNELTKDLENLTSLEILHLEHNKLKRLPGSLMNLQKLRGLHLTYNDITSLPKNIYKLKYLEEIYAGQNPIISVPKSILNMPSLEHLVVNKENLDSKSKEIIKQLKQKKPKVTVIW